MHATPTHLFHHSSFQQQFQFHSQLATPTPTHEAATPPRLSTRIGPPASSYLSALRIVAPLPRPPSSVSVSTRLREARFAALRESTDSKASLSFSPSQEHRSKAISTRRRQSRAPRTGWDSRGRALAERASAGRAWRGMGR